MNDRTIPQNSTYDVATFKLLSEDTDITNAYTVLSLVVNRVVNRVPTAKVILRDGSAADETFSASEGNDLIPGKQLEIAVGFDGKDRSIFKGLIVKQALKVGSDGSSILVLDCKDAVTRMTIGRHSRYFTNSTDSDAIATLFNDYSELSVSVEPTRITHPKIVQYYATDWDFMLSRTEMNGLIVLVEDGTVQVKPPNIDSDPLITLTYGANLLEFETSMDARFQYGAVKAHAWNAADQALATAEATEPTVNNQGNLSGSDLATVAAPDPLELRHGGGVNSQELKAWADAQLLKSRLAKIQGRVKTKGYPDARPDAVIQLGGAGDRFNGQAYVSGIQHELNGGTWHTHMQLGLAPEWFYQQADCMDRPASGLLPGVNGLQIGVVLQLQDDPLGEERILVKAPLIDGEEGIWARMAVLDGGNNRGTIFRPEIGDEVVLGFLNDDPRHPVVLGMLHSSANPTPIPADDANPQKGIVTRSEIKLIFDDETKVVTLETPGGNKITISDEAKGITLEDQNGNIITLNDSGIALKSAKDLTLEATGKLSLKANQNTTVEGLNVSLKANAQFKAEGSAGAEVSTSALAILKGSLVQIN
jgi:Rhs element Vgr protein